MKKIFAILIFGSIALSAIVGYWLYNKPHRNPNSEDAIRVNSADLFNAYVENESVANDRFLDKVLEVNGVVSEITSNQDHIPVVVLASGDPFFGVRCTLQNEQINTQVGDTVTIRGICTGYLSDVIITSGMILKE